MAVIWKTAITNEMVSHLMPKEVEGLIDALDEVMADVFEFWGVDPK